jgi:hypothetical protein
MASQPEVNDPAQGQRGGESGITPQATNPAASAGMASCLTGIILLLLVLGTAIYGWLNPESNIIAEVVFRPWRLALVILLLIVIPIVVFRAVTLWIMGAGPRFVDIDFSWRAGVEAMAKQGINLKSAPLFVIIGAGSDKLRRNFMASVGTEFSVNGVPDVPAPLHWYLSKDAIYLYVDNASWMNLAARQYRLATQQSRSQPGGGGGGAKPAASRRAVHTIMPGGGMPGAEESLGGRNVPDLFSAPKLPGDESIMGTAPPGAGPTVPSPARGARPAYLGTLSPDQVAPPDLGSVSSPRSGPTVARRSRPTSSGESSLQLRRLEAVCSKLRLHRQPVCPLNGILVLLPFDLLQAGRADIEEVERALAGDLSTAKNELQVRCPVTALVVAMEQERGFCELIRRVGPDHAARQRFGHRFDIRRQATVDQLRLFSTYACDVFEEWVYALFKDDQVLTHPGNPALYGLLCKVRRSFQARLSDVLSKGFGIDPHVDNEPLLFSGCYFAATGSQPERQAFVSGVLSKLREEQEELEWTESAWQANSRRGLIALTGWILAGLLALATVLVLVLSDA